MLRTAALLSLLGTTGCAQAVAAGVIATAALTPGVAGMAGAKSGKGDGTLAMGYVHAGDDDSADVEGGWGISLRSVGYIGAKRPVIYLQGRTEAGVFGRDRLYGFTGLDVGPGIHLHDAVIVAAVVGYRYGGYPQNGHAFPMRGAIYIDAGPAVVHGSLYGGWRLGERDEYPAAVSRLGPGWNTWGADIGAEIAGKSGEGVSIGLSFDREDDIGVLSIHIGGAMHPTPEL